MGNIAAATLAQHARLAPAIAQHAARIPTLDSLRGFAILIVMLNHFLQEITLPAGPAGSAVSLLLKILQGNWGISLFLVLSGFLVTKILLDSRQKAAANPTPALRRFYYCRALRIMPLYFAVLAVVFLLVPQFVPADDPSVRPIMAHEPWMWTFLMNIPMLQQGRWIFHGDFLNLTHLWSISAQEQFYLLWPLIIFFAPRRRLAEICLAIILAALGLRCFMFLHGAPPVALYTFTLCRVDTLAVGGLLAVLAHQHPRGLAHLARPAKFLALAAALPLAAYFAWHGSLYWHEPLMTTLGYTLQAVLCAALLVGLATLRPNSPAERLAACPPLAFLGKYAYGIFILHMLLLPLPVQQASRNYLAQLTNSPTLGWLLHAVLALAASTLAAYLSYHFFEKHFLTLKDLLKARRPQPVAAVAPLPREG